MKPILFVLLAASLIANVVLVVSSRRSAPLDSVVSTPMLAAGGSAPATASGQTPSTAATNRAGGSAAPAAVPMAWSATANDQDLHRVVAGLRSAGYPASIIRAIINQLLNERFAARSPNAGQPFWKRNTPPTPESLAAQTALSNERRALFESLLGADARPSALLDTDTRERRYGPLSDDKIDALAKIERDYQEMTAESWAKRRGSAVTPTDMDTMMQSQQLMEKEKLTDLASVLTPEELVQYEMRNSPAAQRLFNNLRNVEITEAEYAQLYAAQKAFDAANPMRTVVDQAGQMQRLTAQRVLNEQARAILGDERFFTYLEGADGMYAMTAQALNKFPTVAPAAKYQVYQLQAELMAQMSRGGQMTPDQTEAMRTTIAGYNTKLEALVGPQVAEAYRSQGMGRVFTSFRTPPRTAAPLVPAGK